MNKNAYSTFELSVRRSAQMGVYMNNMDAVLQNLKDAGCDSISIMDFMKPGEEGWKSEQIRFLERHRKELIETVHTEQKKIDCLDYLIYQLKKEKEDKNI